MSNRIVASASPRRQPAAPFPLIELPGRVIAARELTGADFRLLGLLHLLGARQKPVTRSQPWLAEKLHVDRRTIRGSLARLQARQCVEVIHNTRVDGAFHRLSYRLSY